MINEYRGLSIRPVNHDRLSEYLALFEVVFPTFKTSVEYLDWLYFQNPNGMAVGFDAFDGELLVAHYVCIPIWINVYQKPSLLALNTATHPNYQGRGLLKVLANNTYDKFSGDFACVVGVANSRAIKPLTRHLGFKHLGDLELRFGSLESRLSGRRAYSDDEISWRANCPGRILKSRLDKTNYVKFTRRLYGLFPITAVCPRRNSKFDTSTSRTRGPRSYRITLDWRRGHEPRFFLPKRFKPSPLSFVFRPLAESDFSKLSAWTFPDFDAF